MKAGSIILLVLFAIAMISLLSIALTRQQALNHLAAIEREKRLHKDMAMIALKRYAEWYVKEYLPNAKESTILTFLLSPREEVTIDFSCNGNGNTTISISYTCDNQIFLSYPLRYTS